MVPASERHTAWSSLPSALDAIFICLGFSTRLHPPKGLCSRLHPNTCHPEPVEGPLISAFLHVPRIDPNVFECRPATHSEKRGPECDLDLSKNSWPSPD